MSSLSSRQSTGWSDFISKQITILSNIQPVQAPASTILTTNTGDLTVNSVISSTLTSDSGESLTINNSSGDGLTVTTSGDVEFRSGITFKIERDSTIGTRIVTDKDYFILFDNPLTTGVILPLAASNAGQEYIIARNFARYTVAGPRYEGGGFPFNAFKINASGSDLINETGSGQSSITLPPFARVKLLSDGISAWFVI